MNLKLYGICFKMRGGPDLLDYVQTNSPVPVDIMAQVMDQAGSITRDEMAFAEKLDNDWKKAFNERVPLLMGVAPDGGYDITGTVPDELLDTVHTLTGMENGAIMEEYTANYLSEVCGIDAEIISVDMEHVESTPLSAAMPVQGFSLSDLDAVPDDPAFEDVSEIGGMETGPVPMQEIPDEEAPEGIPYGEEGIPAEEGYPEDREFPYPEEEPHEGEERPGEAEEAPGNSTYAQALAGIYTDLVSNIKDRRLDERLGLTIGQ